MQLTLRYSASIASLCYLILGSVEQDANAKAKDEQLIAAIKGAVAQGIGPEGVEKLVGAKATLNTFRKEDRGPFGRASIIMDPERKESLPDRDSLLWVAYWVRAVEGRNPKLVGIYWPKEGKPQVFFGEILPP